MTIKQAAYQAARELQERIERELRCKSGQNRKVQ